MILRNNEKSLMDILKRIIAAYNLFSYNQFIVVQVALFLRDRVELEASIKEVVIGELLNGTARN